MRAPAPSGGHAAAFAPAAVPAGDAAGGGARGQLVGGSGAGSSSADQPVAGVSGHAGGCAGGTDREDAHRVFAARAGAEPQPQHHDRHDGGAERIGQHREHPRRPVSPAGTGRILPALATRLSGGGQVAAHP
eukprot:ctg_5565.g638